MQGFGSIECGSSQISRGQPYPRKEVLEPNHLDRNRVLALLYRRRILDSSRTPCDLLDNDSRPSSSYG